jgi:hypothetical protein
MASSKALSNKDMNGLKVINLGAPSAASNDAARKVDVETAETNAKSRANHTGTQLASTISDFDTQVRTNRLDQLAPPTNDVSLNNRKITNLLDPGVAQEAATKAYVDAQVAGLVSGQTLKGSVKVAVTSDVNLAAPGATLDGRSMSAGDIFLATAQATGTQNGPYVWNGASSAATRATNWDTDAEAVLGSYWVVREGTRADSFALLTNDTPITLGTTVPAFTFISVAGAAIGRYVANNAGAISAGGTWTVEHNLGSMDVHVEVRRVASPYDFVDVYRAPVDANNVAIIPDIGMAAGEYRAIVKY